MGDIHLWTTYGIIVLTIVAYASERFALELVALASLVAFIALFTFFPYADSVRGVLAPGDLLAGFANPALITVLALLIVGQGLFATDAMDRPARLVSRIAGGSSKRAMIITLLAAAALSAILNNTPVVVIFIPVLAMLAAQRGFSASKAMMPLSFLSILGGMTTLIGSSTNLLVAGIAAKSGIEMGFFDITVPGLCLAAVGAIYVLVVMPRLLSGDGNADESRQIASGVQFIGEIRLGARHPFLGAESKAGMFPALGDLMPRLILRGGETIYPPFENITLTEGDRLVVTATRRAFSQALSRGSAGVTGSENGDHSTDGENVLAILGPDYHLAEAIIAPASRHAGRTVRYAGVENTPGIHMLGIQRKSRMGRTPMSMIRLEPGDTVLLGGTNKAFEQLRDSHDLLVLEWSAEPVPQRRKAWLAFLIFALVVALAASDTIPIVAAAVIGAFAMIGSGCLNLQQAARAFDRQIFLLVGSSIAAATALEHSGGAQLIAAATVNLLAGFGPLVILSGMFAVIAILTNVLSNNATAVLFTPIALGVAEATGAPPAAFIAAVIFAANASFATPIGYQTNLLVMGPGRYSFNDFLKAGIPLVFLMWLTFTLVAPTYYGL